VGATQAAIVARRRHFLWALRRVEEAAIDLGISRISFDTWNNDASFVSLEGRGKLPQRGAWRHWTGGE
jgi:hypothetical protein